MARSRAVESGSHGFGKYSWSVWDQATNGIETFSLVVGEDNDDALIVRFTTQDGQLVLTKFPEYSGDHHADDVVRVRYVPRDPTTARQADEPGASWPAFVLRGFFLVVGIAMVVHSWRFAGDPVVWPPWRRRSV